MALVPIVLTQLGETLEDYSEAGHADEGLLSTCVGVHQLCNGFFDLVKISSTYNCICCRRCHLRIPIPALVKTYGQLRQQCELTI